jgi:hypothetical protein
MILVLVGFLFLSSPCAHALDADELLERSDAVIHPENLAGSFTMTMTSKGKDARVVQATAYQKKISASREDRLFLFSFPPSVRGTGLLVHSYLDQDEDRMWIYLPAVGKIKRVNLSVSGGGYFMGSDFTYSDLISRGTEETNSVLKGETRMGGQECYVVDVQGKTREIQRKYGYSHQVHYIRKSDWVAVKIEFYDLAGDLLKILTVLDVKILGAYRYPSHVTMENVQTGHATDMLSGSLESPEDLPAEYFTLRYLQYQQ